jgi:S1-C subfamily serine protease
MRLRRLPLFAVVACLGVGVGVGGCAAAPVSSPPEQTPTPTIEDPSPAVTSAGAVEVPELSRDSLARQARRLTLRVRNLECRGVALGSGFGLTPGLLVTNRHVLAEAFALEVNTWNGRTLRVNGAAVGTLGDLGIVQVQGRLPEVAKFGATPHRDDPVTAVGYPLGGPLTLSRGVAKGKTYDSELGVDVLRVTAHIQHGNSGGPLLDSQGRVVGVVYALETRTGYGLAIPVRTMLQLVQIGGLQEVPPCGAS